MELQRRYVLNALHKLNPSNGFNVEDTYESLQWFCDKKGKPTEQEFNDAVEAEKKIWEDTQYQRDRNYPFLGEQLDMLFHDMTSGKGDKTGEWYKAVAKVKTDNPKPTE